ncbi:F phosphoribosyltransferase domain protein YhgH required for utilization of DNA [Geitlerinema sp. FC II]|nr:F phosphoribosyltransferase domain protein YhgH required for utilization of DNA [Geitlerinema sp. FC II]
MLHVSEKVRLLARFLDLFLNPNCPLCDRPTDRELCPACFQQLRHCRRSHPQNLRCGSLPVFAWGNYGGTLKRAIAALKYENHPQLARPLGHHIGRAWQKKPLLSDVQLTVVPVPMHPDKQRKRGFNQAELLAQHFCKIARFPLQARGLARIKNTQALFDLNPEQRRRTLDGAIALGKAFRRHPPKHPVLLFDDIYTTGTTVREATRTLNNAGIPVVGIAVLAKAGGNEVRR